jgi:hypothetical protein
MNNVVPKFVGTAEAPAGFRRTELLETSMAAASGSYFRGRFQFSLLAMLEYMTICSLLAALSPLVGMPASVALMLLALAVWVRIGLLAIALLMVSLMAACGLLDPRSDMTGFAQTIVTVLAALAIAFWFRWRHRPTFPFPNNNGTITLREWAARRNDAREAVGGSSTPT